MVKFFRSSPCIFFERILCCFSTLQRTRYKNFVPSPTEKISLRTSSFGWLVRYTSTLVLFLQRCQGTEIRNTIFVGCTFLSYFSDCCPSAKSPHHGSLCFCSFYRPSRCCTRCRRPPVSSPWPNIVFSDQNSAANHRFRPSSRLPLQVRTRRSARSNPSSLLEPTPSYMVFLQALYSHTLELNRF